MSETKDVAATRDEVMLGPHMELNAPTPCPECGSAKWVPEMGGSVDLRHYRGCSGWSSYFDGGTQPPQAAKS